MLHLEREKKEEAIPQPVIPDDLTPFHALHRVSWRRFSSDGDKL